LQNLDAIIDGLEVIEHGASREIVEVVSAKWKGTREGECIARIIKTLE